jgi:hypothetical protein
MTDPQTFGETQMQLVEKKMGKKNWGMFFNSHHFWGKKVCWGFEMGLE